jgi:hypothetical protein
MNGEIGQEWREFSNKRLFFDESSVFTSDKKEEDEFR